MGGVGNAPQVKGGSRDTDSDGEGMGDDEELLEHAYASKSGDAIRALMRIDLSAADMAPCSHVGTEAASMPAMWGHLCAQERVTAAPRQRERRACVGKEGCDARQQCALPPSL